MTLLQYLKHLRQWALTFPLPRDIDEDVTDEELAQNKALNDRWAELSEDLGWDD